MAQHLGEESRELPSPGPVPNAGVDGRREHPATMPLAAPNTCRALAQGTDRAKREGSEVVGSTQEKRSLREMAFRLFGILMASALQKRNKAVGRTFGEEGP